MTQEELVVGQLNTFGKVSRNWALRNYISRLSAITYDLKKKGWEFKKEREGGDYIYRVTKKIDLSDAYTKEAINDQEMSRQQSFI